MNRKIFCWLFALFIGSAAVNLNLQAQGTAFYYQGHLSDGGTAANGNYDLQFSLYDAPTNGNLISGPLTNLAVAVTGGLFTTNIDFGEVFTGNNYWLAIGVRTNGSTNAFTVLQPLQPVLPVPYAIFANSASNLLGTVSTAQLLGTLTATQLSGTYSSAINLANPGNNFAGNGSQLANLNGSQITTGTVADTRLSTNVALLDANQMFTGSNYFTSSNTFTNRGNYFVGSFFGNGLVGWIPVSVTSTQAMPDAGYLLLSSNLTTVTLPTTNVLLVGDIVRIAGAGSGGWLVAQNTNESIVGLFYSQTNSSWLQASASSLGWVTIAASADGSKMIASAVGGSGIYTSINYGQTWNNSSSTYSPVAVASSASGQNLFGAIQGGGIVYSPNVGSTWNVSSAPSAAWDSIATSADGTKLAAVVYGGFVYTSTNSGVTWGNANNSPSAGWTAVASSADGTKLAAAVFNGKIYTSVNTGTNWTQQTGSPTAGWISVASSSDGSKLVAVSTNSGNSGLIYTSANYGVSWTLSSNAPAAGWHHVTCSGDGGQIFAVANPGGIYASANFGLTWTPQPVSTQDWTGVACSADGTKVAATYETTTTSGAIYYWQPSSQAAVTTTGVNGFISGGQGASVELQYIGNGKFMPVSSSGTFWAN